jgi:hypothetical protein
MLHATKQKYELGPNTTFIARVESGMAKDIVPCVAVLTLAKYPTGGGQFLFRPFTKGNHSKAKNIYLCFTFKKNNNG